MMRPAQAHDEHQKAALAEQLRGADGRAALSQEESHTESQNLGEYSAERGVKTEGGNSPKLASSGTVLFSTPVSPSAASPTTGHEEDTTHTPSAAPPKTENEQDTTHTPSAAPPKTGHEADTTPSPSAATPKTENEHDTTHTPSAASPKTRHEEDTTPTPSAAPPKTGHEEDTTHTPSAAPPEEEDTGRGAGSSDEAGDHEENPSDAEDDQLTPRTPAPTGPPCTAPSPLSPTAHPAQEPLSPEEEEEEGPTGQSVTMQGDIIMDSPRKQSVSSDKDGDSTSDNEEFHLASEDLHGTDHTNTPLSSLHQNETSGQSQDQEEETRAESTGEAGANQTAGSQRQREERREQDGGKDEGGAQPSGAGGGGDETSTADPALELPTPEEEEELQEQGGDSDGSAQDSEAGGGGDENPTSGPNLELTKTSEAEEQEAGREERKESQDRGVKSPPKTPPTSALPPKPPRSFTLQEGDKMTAGAAP
ncbi:cell surface glycoprotein 1-like [Conger conger]|uniref:cell surface glycoprotein 1-like n=1 Tax=Conger conger TaxID=82655 RepID=UPI002A5ACF5B|nr:cell surface glycoprotein 1-like [Conger conger]